MGLDLGALWNQAQDKINASLEDVKKVGIPALESSGEAWAANVLTEQAKKLGQDSKEKQKQVNEAVKDITARPSEPGSFGSFFSQTLMGAGANAKGPLLIGGVIALLVVGYFLAKKGK